MKEADVKEMRGIVIELEKAVRARRKISDIRRGDEEALKVWIEESEIEEVLENAIEALVAEMNQLVFKN